MTDWTKALQDLRKDEPSFFWRLRYQDKYFSRLLIEALNELIKAPGRKALSRRDNSPGRRPGALPEKGRVAQ